ncbi:putative disease resistance protein RGA3 isoform X2 [Papaver somniferum]|nr:putative disease resistance protein RGA3 isoform X2 [Papaver somniferum]XP_026424075.1 putative disease resistance protein RGA3 isoform X2 [Papaver somniferum]
MNIRNLISVADQHIGMGWGVPLPDELKKLRDTLDRIQPVIGDARKKQVNNESVSGWLRRLQDVIYDADDLLDVYSYEAIRRKVKASEGNMVRQFFISSSNPLAFHIKMSSKFKNINSRLGEIIADMGQFKFEITGSFYHDQTLVPTNQPISFIPDTSKIFGRETDKSNIISMLMTSTSASLASCLEDSIICIVGMEGLGKTSLAQVVYRDRLIQSNFEPRLWICVSNDFNVKEVLRNILVTINHTKCDDFDTLKDEEIVVEVQEKLAGKKYLFIFDDILSADAAEWAKFRSYLSVGAPGSKILVTTGNGAVASLLSPIIPPYALQKLSQNECWSIMKNKAFSPGGASDTLDMAKIGIEIAGKCDGSPFASYFLGGLMHLKNSEPDWLSIRDNNILSKPAGILTTPADNKDRIRSISKLSFDELSPNLKQCFSYTSMFPHGWEFDRETLVQLWVAEGFIPLSYGEHQKSPEDIANEYFHSLVSCSFFYDVKKDEIGDIQKCKVQGIVRELALEVAGNNGISRQHRTDDKSPDGVRRLVLQGGASQDNCRELHKSDGLRSIFILKNRHSGVSNILRSKRLRVVSFLGERSPIIAPSFASKLKHLRYLNLSHSVFKEVSGASVISEFYNLQTLVLHRCTNVHMILRASTVGDQTHLFGRGTRHSGTD